MRGGGKSTSLCIRRASRIAVRALLTWKTISIDTVAQAQDFSNVASGYSAQASNTLAMIVAGTGSRAVRQRVAEGSPDGAHGPASNSQQGRNTLTYRPSAALARATVDGFVDRLSRANPLASKAAASQFQNEDYGLVYRALVVPFGLRDDNAADAVTAYTVLGWLIATGASDPQPRDVAAVREQLEPRLAAHPQFLKADTTAQLGEEFKLLFVTLHAGWQSARREGKLQQYSDGVAAMFLKQGTDLRALQLTHQGFVAR